MCASPCLRVRYEPGMKPRSYEVTLVSHGFSKLFEPFFLLYLGYGELNVNGGNGGGSSAGGGAGGRIAVYANTNTYRGTYLAFGGSSSSGTYGGPGTVFLQDIRAKKPFTQLRLGLKLVHILSEFILVKIL